MARRRKRPVPAPKRGRWLDAKGKLIEQSRERWDPPPLTEAETPARIAARRIIR